MIWHKQRSILSKFVRTTILVKIKPIIDRIIQRYKKYTQRQRKCSVVIQIIQTGEMVNDES